MDLKKCSALIQNTGRVEFDYIKVLYTLVIFGHNIGIQRYIGQPR